MDNRGNIVIYQTKDGKTSIDVKLEDETVWLTQAQMAELFQTDRTSIVKCRMKLTEKILSVSVALLQWESFM